jgi:hypothetical protein
MTGIKKRKCASMIKSQLYRVLLLEDARKQEEEMLSNDLITIGAYSFEAVLANNVISFYAQIA